MKITVEHEIPCDKGLELTCKYAGITLTGTVHTEEKLRWSAISLSARYLTNGYQVSTKNVINV